MSTSPLQTLSSYPAVVGQVLCGLRKAAGMEQAELARAAGVSQSTWSRIETGRSALSVEQLADAAGLLEVPAGEIMRLADASVADLRQRGVEIRNRRLDGGTDTGLVILGAAAIGTQVGMLLKNRDAR